LLSYNPPTNAFEENRHDQYHRIHIKVKRSGCEIHTRDGFFSSSPPSKFNSMPQADTLTRAIYSPFLQNDLKLNLSSGYAHAPVTGYFLRSWLHLDGSDLTFNSGKGGGYSLSLDLELLTSGSNGQVQDQKYYRYDFTLNNEDLERIRRKGIDLKASLPVRNPGDYYVRAAVRDSASGKIGTGYQFLEIPDLDKRRLSLSSIFVLIPGEDASAIPSALEQDGGSSDSMRQWQALSKSPALRTYLPGDTFDYATMVYNAKAKEGSSPKLEFQYILFKNGQLFQKSNPEELDLKGMDDFGNIPIVKKLVSNEKMDSGAYLLYLRVTDKQKSRTADQSIDFQIGKE
jgi:hypothetical protein